MAVSVAGLAGVALQISQTLLDYYKDVKNAQKDIEELRREFETLNVVANQLKSFLESEKARGMSFEQTTSVLCSAVSVCKAKVKEIASRLKKPRDTVIHKAVQSLVWPFKKDELQDMMDMLRRYNQLFQFSLSIEGW